MNLEDFIHLTKLTQFLLLVTHIAAIPLVNYVGDYTITEIVIFALGVHVLAFATSTASYLSFYLFIYIMDKL